jgi:large subunit ribosomal protein L30
MSKLHITLKKSTIGYSGNQSKIIQSLGLKRLNHSVDREDTPTIRGMIYKVRHLVQVTAGE